MILSPYSPYSLCCHPYLSNALSVRGTINDMSIPFPNLSLQAEAEVVHGASMQGTNNKKSKVKIIISREERP